MTGKLTMSYVHIVCYNGRAMMHFGATRPDGSIKTRKVGGPSTRFSNIVGDIQMRLTFGRGRMTPFSQGWGFYPLGPARRG